MRHKFEIAILVIALLVVPGVVMGQVSLEDQLKAQYTVAKMGSDSSGYSVVQEGTLLTIQKGGIVGVPYKNVATRIATFKDGTVHASDPTNTGGTAGKLGTMGCGLLHRCPSTPDALQGEKTTKLFKVGDKVYPEKISVNLGKDSVIFGIVACDTCNNTDPPTYNKAQIIFQFPAGSLATTSASQVEDVIAGLLAIDDSPQSNNNQQGGNDQQGNNQQGNNQGGGGGQAQQQAPAPDPVQIEKGQTPEQVKAAIGTPDKMINLGAKQIWVYKDIKVTFINGKVSDVQ